MAEAERRLDSRDQGKRSLLSLERQSQTGNTRPVFATGASMAIPQLAIDRYLRLRHKSDDLFAARREAQEAWMHERSEVGRLEGSFRSLFPSLHIEIDDAGNITQIEFCPASLAWLGTRSLPVDSRHRKTPLRVDAGTSSTFSFCLLLVAVSHRPTLSASG